MSAGQPRSSRFDLLAALGGPARRHVVLLLAAVLGLQSADSGAIGSLAAPIEGAFHVGNVAVGLIATSSTLIGSVTTLPFGVLVDRWNRTRLLQIVAVVWGVSTMVSGASTSFDMLLAVRVFQGGLTAVAGPALASLAGDLFPTEERGRLWSYVLVGELAGAGVGILVTGVLSGIADWRVALSALGLPAFALAWALHRHLPEPLRGGASRLPRGATRVPTAGDAATAPGAGERPARLEAPSAVERLAEEMGVEAGPRQVIGHRRPLSTWQAVKFVLRIPSNDALIFASGIGYFFVQGLEIFAELFFRERYGVGQSGASVLFVVIAAGAILGVVLSGQAADRLIGHGKPAGRMIVGAVTFVGTTVVFVPATLLTSAALAIPFMVIAAAFLGAVNPPVDTARLDVVPSFLWGRAEAVRTALRQALQGLAPLLFGLVSAAFGAPRTGFGAGVNTKRAQLPAGGGHGLEVAFMLFSIPMLVAGAALWLSRSAYLRDTVAARRSDELHLGARP
ncbi:MAG: MFS transporter [Acidimicrobiales bacterium]